MNGILYSFWFIVKRGVYRMKHCMLMSVLSLLFSLLLPVTVQHAAGISGG